LLESLKEMCAMVNPEQSPSLNRLGFIREIFVCAALLFFFAVSTAPAQSGHVIHYSSVKPKGVTSQVAPTVVGSRVYWFSISTNGYGSPPISMISASATGAQTDSAGNVYVLTDAQGDFHISASNPCPSPDASMYVLVNQGVPAGSSWNNAYIAMVGIAPVTCSGGNWFVDVTETTTVAAAYALISFATVATDSFASNSSSTAALQGAVAYANSLVNSSTAVIPSGSPWETTINTLGDILARCIDASAYCNTLLGAVTSPAGARPSDTFQAILDIALNPNVNLTSNFNYVGTASPFQPILTSYPSSWALPGTLQITGVTPSPAPLGSSVTIAGTGFGATQGNGAVEIGGVQATVTSWSNTSIVAIVPSGAASNGTVQIFSNGSWSNQIPISIGPLVAPGLISLSLSHGPATMGFVINGTNFGSTQGSSSVTMSGTALNVLAWNDPLGTRITVQVPDAAVAGGNVVVTVSGIPSNGIPFALEMPY
jgi:hypothetical protein